VREDEEAIRRTLGEYSQRCDDGRFDEWAELFTADARLVLAGTVTEGRDAIKEYMMTVQAAGRRGMHVTTNSLVDVDVDGDTATATTDYLFVRPTTDGLAIIAAGRYYDRLIRDETRWRFRERSITMLPAAAGGSDG
jgi:uncharacterized protein (TIGR02246 family)